MTTHADFADFFQLLNEHGVEYMVVGRYGDVEVSFIGKEDLLRNKRSTGRQRDLGDVEELT